MRRGGCQGHFWFPFWRTPRQSSRQGCSCHHVGDELPVQYLWGTKLSIWWRWGGCAGDWWWNSCWKSWRASCWSKWAEYSSRNTGYVGSFNLILHSAAEVFAIQGNQSD
jgi:hypothetical protein